MEKRSSGVLLHIASMPGPYAIGTMGVESLSFLQQLKQAGFAFWQVLPLTIVDEFNSPYKSLSAFACNSCFIDPRGLVSDGLLFKDEVEKYFTDKFQSEIDYKLSKENIGEILALAWQRVTPKLQKHIDQFVANEAAWLKSYACFVTAKKFFAGLPWWEWQDTKLALHDEQAVAKFTALHEDEIKFYYFEQWVFYRQWLALRKQANELGIGIIGDMPFYVDCDSADVWANRQYFAVEGNKFTEVAGVPPDYFSAQGQLWGNPLYNWDSLQADNFGWWKLRIKHAMKLYDKVRIDHYRALITYWAVPFGSPDATKGRWCEAPYDEFCQEVLAEFDHDAIFAEDLGEIDAYTRNKIDATDIATMRVMQFSFADSGLNPDLPHNWNYNTVAYTGTHDNTTLLAWIWEMNPSLRKFILKYLDFPENADWGLGGYGSPIVRKVIRQLWLSKAKLTILPIQDLCGFGGDTRMNTPGKVVGNWSYRLPFAALEMIDWRYFAELNNIYQRNSKLTD